MSRINFKFVFDKSLSGKERKDKLYHEYIKAGLVICDGNRTKASQYLGICLRSVQNFVKKNPEIAYQARVKKLTRAFESPKEKKEKLKEYEKGFKEIPVLNILKLKIESTKKTFWFRQSSKEEQEEVIARLINQYGPQ